MSLMNKEWNRVINPCAIVNYSPVYNKTTKINNISTVTTVTDSNRNYYNGQSLGMKQVGVLVQVLFHYQRAINPILFKL